MDYDISMTDVSKVAGARALKSYFAEHPGYQPNQPPRKPPAPHYIDTTQQPEDSEDTLRSLGGLFGTTFGIILGVAAVALVTLHFWYGPPF